MLFGNTADSKKCPSCGGNLIFNSDEQMLVCYFCGGSFSPEKLDLLSTITVFDTEESGEEEEDKTEIVCGACGASIITDKNTSATFCAFCGSPSLVTNRLTRRFRPDYVIPFKISKEDAITKIREFAKSGRYVPKSVLNDKNIKKITGLYVPFWLMDSRCEIHSSGVGYKNHLSTRDKYNVISDVDISLKAVPFDGALELEDDLMESIEPFDMSEMVSFNSSYLQGFYAKRYDLSVDRLSDRIIARLQRYGREAVSYLMMGYDSYSSDFVFPTPHDLTQKYALFPIWLLTYEYDGKRYQIAVNAQTGKVDGHLPVNKFKRAGRLLLYHLHNVIITAPIWVPIVCILALFYKYVDQPLIMLISSVLLIPLSLVMVYICWLFIKDWDFFPEKGFWEFDLNKPLRNLFKKIVAHRKEIHMNLKISTNNLLNQKPPVKEYFDTTAKIDFKKEEIPMGQESYFDPSEN